ncbi:MAG TPA: hypothetical protein VIS49_01585, partial [Cyclobacteriaceae bacterium]
MKTKKTKTCQTVALKWIACYMLVLISAAAVAQNQKKTAAVLGIDSKGVIQDAESVGYMVRLELEKANVYNV